MLASRRQTKYLHMEIQTIHQKIYEIRGQRVMLDFDLAELYEVETRVLNQAVKRNIDIFPIDFMFQLSENEWSDMSSQFVMTSKRPKSAIPMVFTEHGVTMLSNVLRSKKARNTSVMIVRAFIALKQYTINYNDISIQLKQLESKYDKQFDDIYEAINYLLKKDNQEKKQKQMEEIGYKKN